MNSDVKFGARKEIRIKIYNRRKNEKNNFNINS